jgi:hypothetical protein
MCLGASHVFIDVLITYKKFYLFGASECDWYQLLQPRFGHVHCFDQSIFKKELFGLFCCQKNDSLWFN